MTKRILTHGFRAALAIYLTPYTIIAGRCASGASGRLRSEERGYMAKIDA